LEGGEECLYPAIPLGGRREVFLPAHPARWGRRRILMLKALEKLVVLWGVMNRVLCGDSLPFKGRVREGMGYSA
jgi:hypothetical protein